jgi:hypothetical protein
MVERFVDTEMDRTKVRWVTRVLKEFGRPRTTIRALFYFGLQRTEEDYPIVGGIVGEIRVNRRFDINDRDKLEKWVLRGKQMGFISWESVIDESSGDMIIPAPQDVAADASVACRLSDVEAWDKKTALEIWINRSDLIPLLEPSCRREGAVLVCVRGLPSWGSAWNLCKRSAGRREPTSVLCLTDLSPQFLPFCRDLALKVGELNGSFYKSSLRINAGRIGITRSQGVKMRLPMIPAQKVSKEEMAAYRSYLLGSGLDGKLMAEVDSLEVHYPGGLAAFVSDAMKRIAGGSEPVDPPKDRSHAAFDADDYLYKLGAV